MPKITYDRTASLTPASVARVDQANDIIAEYEEMGFVLTLRQLYYQFVARDLIPNTQRSYENLGTLINKARMMGLVDWNAIEDRTRFMRGNSHWDDPASIIDSCIEGYRIDKWADQKNRPEVWIEKDALIGVIEGVCEDLDVDYFSCRGYVSASAMWRGGVRMFQRTKEEQRPIVLHLGDHDPSGIDMTNDIRSRLHTFSGGRTKVTRIALTMDQVREYDPPPNPAKMSDSRAADYVAEYGYDSWELDALPPDAIAQLIRDAVEGLRDDDKWDIACAKEEDGRDKLRTLRDQADME